MKRFLDILGQGAAYLAFAMLIGYFSTRPAYRPLPASSALVKLSISHPGQRVAPCRKRSAEEIRNMPPNMRTVAECPRERHPVQVELKIDGETVFRDFSAPSGLARDGKSLFYERFRVDAGKHLIAVRLYDDDPAASSGYADAKELSIAAGSVVIVGFDRTAKRFIIR
ncbi:MAG: hypothetical protein QGH73_18530 [Rhodospirillales bacterium]|jgi:hypothetical protein|nr:hypothetical protein [Rhodospirillales bacterium]